MISDQAGKDNTEHAKHRHDGTADEKAGKVH
jgi:hypothetical protein